MRFITEFEIALPAIEQRIDAYKSRGNLDLGSIISTSFGWKERPYHDQRGGNDIGRWALEIEAFPVDKWVEFKNRLFAHLGTTGLYDKTFKDLVSELESFRNPVT